MNNKKLYKVEEGKMICGVCGGIAEYFSIDVSLVRIAAAICCAMAWGGIAYIVAACILPKKSDVV